MNNRKLIFIVDDDPVISKLIVRRFESEGYKVEAFRYGEDCIKALASNPDLIILDYFFVDGDNKVMNGIEMLDMMAQEKLLQKTPVLICSTEGSKTRIEELFKKGVRAFIRKPITPEILRNVVREVMGDYDAC